MKKETKDIPGTDRNGLSDAEVLKALYNVAKPLGLGLLHYIKEDMTLEQAQDIIKNRGDDVTAMLGKSINPYFDYLQGRVIKTDISENPLRLDLFNRDNGVGAGEKAIELALIKKAKESSNG